MSEKKTVTRRKFLGIAWGGSTALVFGQAALALLKFIKPVSAGGFGGSIYAGKVEEFAVGSINRILAGRFYISRTDEGIWAVPFPGWRMRVNSTVPVMARFIIKWGR